MALVWEAKKELENYGLNHYEVFALDEFKTLSDDAKLLVRLSAEQKRHYRKVKLE